MADSIPCLVPSQFQESIFPPVTRPKIPALTVLVSLAKFKELKKTFPFVLMH